MVNALAGRALRHAWKRGITLYSVINAMIRRFLKRNSAKALEHLTYKNEMAK